ncbi:AarF/UbiB family protein [Deinococcus radiopugnans]|uniref:AarF/UbiB family protein n=1 Tax=Deinococcus radiopugnans TaxID=57497 RepID=UPI0036187423
MAELTIDGRARAARQIFTSVLRQITVDGVFHADPHPGNIMLLRDGNLGLIDMGSVGRIDRELQAGLQQIILAVEYAEPQQLTDALLQTLGRPEHLDEPRLRRALGRFIVTRLQQGERADIAMFSDLLQIVTAHGLHVPAELAAAFRAIATLEGTLALLDPGFDIVAEARQVASAQLKEELAPQNVRRALERELVAALPMLRRLPRHVDQLASALGEGRLSVNVRLFSDARDQAVVGEWLRQVLLAFLAAVLGLIAVGLLALPGGPRLSDALTLYQLLAYNAGLVSTIMVLRVLFVLFRR